MGSQPASYTKITFGPFEYEPVSGDLRKFGTRIRLQGKPLQILTFLLNRPGEVVTREELQNHLWHGTTFVDFEQGLNSAVNKLRQALGDSPDQPRYVETLPGRGYRFVGVVQPPSPKTVLAMARPVEIPPAAPHSRYRWVFAGIAASVLTVAAYWAGTSQSLRPVVLPTVRFRVTPPSGFILQGATSRQSFGLSPDGSRLAYAALDTSGAFQLFLRDLNQLDSRSVPNTRGIHTFFWAPSGESVYVSISGKIRHVPLNADGFTTVSDSPAYTYTGVGISRDTLLLDANRSSYTIPISGGTPAQLKDAYHWPQRLPGTDALLYVAWNDAAKRFNVLVGGIGESARATQLVVSDSRAIYVPSTINPGTGYLLYTSAGILVAHPFDVHGLRVTGDAVPVANRVYSFMPLGVGDFTASPNGTLAYHQNVPRSQLIWVDRSGHRLSEIGPANANLNAGRLSPDSSKIAAPIYDPEKGSQTLWIIDARTGAARLLTSAFGLRDAPVWSPDGATLAFMHGSGGRAPKIGIRGLSENSTEWIESDGDFQAPSDWSPDGRFLVFGNSGFPRMANDLQGDIWLMDLQRQRKRVPLLHSTFHEASASFSPDGRWLAFMSNESGRAELYLQAFTGGDNPAVSGERYLVSAAGCQTMRWRRDGKEIFYLGFDGRVHAVPIQLGTRPVIGATLPLFSIPVEARAAFHSLPGFDVSGDGQRFLIPSVAAGEPPSIVVVQNWEAALPISKR